MIIGAKLISIFGGDKKCKYTQRTYVYIMYIFVIIFAKNKRLKRPAGAHFAASVIGWGTERGTRSFM